MDQGDRKQDKDVSWEQKGSGFMWILRREQLTVLFPVTAKTLARGWAMELRGGWRGEGGRGKARRGRDAHHWPTVTNRSLRQGPAPPER